MCIICDLELTYVLDFITKLTYMSRFVYRTKLCKQKWHRLTTEADVTKPLYAIVIANFVEKSTQYGTANKTISIILQLQLSFLPNLVAFCMYVQKARSATYYRARKFLTDLSIQVCISKSVNFCQNVSANISFLQVRIVFHLTAYTHFIYAVCRVQVQKNTIHVIAKSNTVL